jgi:CPA1 family monovalent cation:H+ antiporter
LVIIGWAGMRGVDSLATALALPFVTAAGMPFPGRDTIIFISFAVILVTLVAQGLTLPLLIRMLNVTGDGKADCEESVARIKANEAALSFLENLVTKDTEYNDELNLLIAQYQERLGQLRSEEEAGEQAPGESAQEGSPFRRFAHEALQKEYEALIDLRNRHRINDETLRVVQRDVDLAETRLAEMDE